MFSERDKECIRSKNSPVAHYQSHQIGTLGKCAGHRMQLALLPCYQFPQCFTFRSQTCCFAVPRIWYCFLIYILLVFSFVPLCRDALFCGLVPSPTHLILCLGLTQLLLFTQLRTSLYYSPRQAQLISRIFFCRLIFLFCWRTFSVTQNSPGTSSVF